MLARRLVFTFCQALVLLLKMSIFIPCSRFLHDNNFGNLRDGRVAGDSQYEKAQNFLNNIILASPFADNLSNHAKIVNYALRQHPAPSRLARCWEITSLFCREPIFWCEREKIKYSPLSLDPGRFSILIPAQKAWDLLHHLYGEYVSRFGRVRHLLPLHLSATVFYHKAPLYIALDAARRFSRLGLDRKTQSWQLKERKSCQQSHHMLWEDRDGRKIKWKVPKKLPNNTDDRFYSWFWECGNDDHPIHVSELECNKKYRVSQSTFDYEILDATVRRYDIRLEGEKRRRPHLFMRDDGPRSYPLEVLSDWKKLEDVIAVAENSQVKQFQEQLASLHDHWHGDVWRDERRAMIRDMVANHLPVQGREQLIAMAEDGSLFDYLEWYYFIRKKS